jgi:uncharacterized small protein (DUF1192 family)
VLEAAQFEKAAPDAREAPVAAVPDSRVDVLENQIKGLQADIKALKAKATKKPAAKSGNGGKANDQDNT